MSNPNGRKGNGFEIDFVKWCREKGLDAERLRMAGMKDEGDVVLKVGGEPYVCELKNVAKINLGGWVKEAEIEAGHYAEARSLQMPPYFVVVHKRRNHPMMNAFVTTPLWQFIEIISTPF